AAGVKQQAQNPIVQTPPPLTDSKTLSIQHNTKKEEGIPYTGVSSSILSFPLSPFPSSDKKSAGGRGNV
ncbi:MAG: hypothetical protein MR893_08155, partial [Prevotellaceae bacterium]|nr:hypothetical protein [Prevotellaceae bacterium]